MRGLRNMGKGKVALVEDLPDPQPGDAGGVFVDHKSIGGDINYLWTVTRYR